MNIRFFILAASVFSLSNLKAQVQLSQQLDWENTEVTYPKEKLIIPSFTGASFYPLNGVDLPHFTYSVWLDHDEVLTELDLNVLSSRKLEKGSYPILNALNNDENLKVRYSNKANGKLATISFCPINIEKEQIIESFQLLFSKKVIPKRRHAKAANSLLSTGDWVKLAVLEEGLYELSKSELVAAGLDLGNANPNNIRMFGYGGAPLPLNNGLVNFDDMEEIAIQVTGNNDAVWDSNEKIRFYGQSAHTWNYNGAKFIHKNNPFSDTAFYFLSLDQGAGKRIQEESPITAVPTVVKSSFTDVRLHENNWTSVQQSGQEWFGEYFDLTDSYNFSFLFPNAVIGSQGKIRARAIARNDQTSFMSFVKSPNTILNMQLSPVNVASYNGPYVSASTQEGTFTVSSDGLVLTANYNDMGNPGALAWLDYIEVKVERSLKGGQGVLLIQQEDVIGAGQFVQYNISQYQAGEEVWRISNHNAVSKMPLNISGSDANFVYDATEFERFAYVPLSGFRKVANIKKIENQNLHATGPSDMLIITHPVFEEKAQSLADFHLEDRGLKCTVATTDKIYNEFSSGAQDPMGIRMFIKYVYDTYKGTSDSLKHVLFFGDASYDVKDRIDAKHNFVISYASSYSLGLNGTYVSDDFFGYLGDDEGDDFLGTDLDIGIGRLPVKTLTEAEEVIQKIKNYRSPNSFGDWRNNVMFVSDDVDEDWETMLVKNTDRQARRVDTTYKWLNLNKIYLDAFEQVSTATGDRYPDAKEAMLSRMEKGVLLLDYIGHGGELGLADESILTINDINAFRNFDALNVMVTITCEFTRYDDANRTSAGERMVLNSKGGSVAIFSTTRQVGAGSAIQMGDVFFEYIFEKEGGKSLAMGEVMRRIKNDPAVINDGTKLRFSYFGDPSLPLAQAEKQALVSKINGVQIQQFADTLNALSLVSIDGELVDTNGAMLNDFNGIVVPVIFDKSSTLQTLDNDGEASPSDNYPISFDLQQNILYKGKSEVTNGEFSFSFVVPKDIAYQIDKGKISLYAFNDSVDATGYYEEFLIGGSSKNPEIDEQGPEVELYMNDESFVYGGITDDSPTIFAKIRDENGVNTVGNGIGHDLRATIDENTSSSIVLNDFYEADLNSYQSGTIRYPLRNLEPGRHTLDLKVWDVYNNSSLARTEFVVAESAKLALDHVLNYPNPFTTYTEFHFEHNRPNEPLEVQVQILTISGKLVKTINQLVSSSGYRIRDIKWDGLDDFGDQIGKGVYIYRLKVRSSVDQSVAEKYEKLVILR